MLYILSGLAVVVLMEWFLITAWLSRSQTAWQYNFWAFVIVLLWAQPWSSRNPYRTGRQITRNMVYLVLLLATLASAIVFKRWGPLLVTLEILILALIEFAGRRSLKAE